MWRFAVAMTPARPFPAFRANRIAACVAALLGLALPASAPATTWTVDSCSEANSGNVDTKVGTLRFAAEYAADGDTIDMTGLGCSTISLQKHAIRFFRNPKVLGPGENSLTITGSIDSYNDRVINHTGGGLLTLCDLTLSNGYVDQGSSGPAAKGGCIYSSASLALHNVDVHDCTASGYNGAYGGAVYAKDFLLAESSTLTHNTAIDGPAGYYGRGGAIDVEGGFIGAFDTISNNTATSFLSSVGGFYAGRGGGLYLRGDAIINSSTISGNTAGLLDGGIDAFNPSPAGTTLAITNCTITGNNAGDTTGGVFTDDGTINISNSTITANSAANDQGPLYLTNIYGIYRAGTDYDAPGLSIDPAVSNISVDLQSSLISGNRYGNAATESDVSVVPYFYYNYAAGRPTATLAGSNNLVRVAQNAALPGFTLNSCPLLGPLRDNGGPTRTRALLSASPAIDAGNNDANLTTDQRGATRVSGSAADIGAYEVQQDNEVFDGDFDGCAK